MSAGGVPACLAAAGMKWFWNVRSAWGIAIPVLLPVLELVSFCVLSGDPLPELAESELLRLPRLTLRSRLRRQNPRAG